MIETDWNKVITDPVERKLFEALEDPRWEWRTISALSKASGLNQEGTRQVLRKYPVLVRQSVVPAANGEDLYTLRSRYFERQSTLEKFWNSVSSSPATFK